MTLSPDTIAKLIGLAITGIGFLVHKARGDKRDDHGTTLEGLAGQAAHMFLTAVDDNLADVRARMTAYLWIGAARVGVPRNAATEAMAAAVVEYAISELLAELRARDTAIAANFAAAKAELAKAPPPAPAIPNIAANMTVVELGPNDPMPAADGSK